LTAWSLHPVLAAISRYFGHPHYGPGVFAVGLALPPSSGPP
jgi:hypothetical protein